MVNRIYICANGITWRKTLSDYDVDQVKSLCNGRQVRSLAFCLFTPLHTEIKKLPGSLLFPLTTMKAVKLKRAWFRAAACCTAIFIDLLTLPLRFCRLPFRHKQLTQQAKAPLPLTRFLRSHQASDTLLQAKRLKLVLFCDLAHSLAVKQDSYLIYLQESLKKEVKLHVSRIVEGPSQKAMDQFIKLKNQK